MFNNILDKVNKFFLEKHKNENNQQICNQLIKQASSNLDLPRFEEPFYKNYDLYEDETDIGPGGGLYQYMKNYKSVKDFLNKKRKKKKSKKKAREKLLSFVKIAIDFPADNYEPFNNDSSNNSILSDSIGGQTDYANPYYDFEDKSIDKLNFGRDYKNDLDKIQELLNLYLNPANSPIYGLEDGVNIEDEDMYNKNPYSGILDSDNAIRNRKF